MFVLNETNGNNWFGCGERATLAFDFAGDRRKRSDIDLLPHSGVMVTDVVAVLVVVNLSWSVLVL